MYVHTQRTYSHMCIHIHTHNREHIQINSVKRKYIPACAQHTHVHKHTHTHTHTHTYRQTQTDIHTDTHIP